MPIIPYRAKNPPERFPYVTIGLIAVNFLVYGCTTHDLLSVRQSAITALAVSHTTLSPWRLLTSMFLHANPLHILGNMLFLWVFGAALEGRLGHARYLLVYLISGIAAGLLNDLAIISTHPDEANLGASGAIMGIAGAYLYVFPFSHIRVFRLWLMRLITPPEWEARWVVAYFLFFNIVDEYLYQGADGVGHLAHLGGAFAGVLCVWAMRTRRDTETVSAAQAIHADMKDYSLLSYPELEALMQRPTQDPRLIMAYCQQAWSVRGGGDTSVLPVLQLHGRTLMEHADAVALAGVLLRLSPEAALHMPSLYYLKLGSRLEAAHEYLPALSLYQRLVSAFPASPDAAAAWLRAGKIQERIFGSREQASICYQQLLTRFPQSSLAFEAKRSLETACSVGVSPMRIDS